MAPSAARAGRTIPTSRDRARYVPGVEPARCGSKLSRVDRSDHVTLAENHETVDRLYPLQCCCIDSDDVDCLRPRRTRAIETLDDGYDECSARFVRENGRSAATLPARPPALRGEELRG